MPTLEALLHVTDYLGPHIDSVIRLVVGDDPQEALVVPRGAEEFLARVLRTASRRRCTDREELNLPRCLRRIGGVAPEFKPPRWSAETRQFMGSETLRGGREPG